MYFSILTSLVLLTTCTTAVPTTVEPTVVTSFQPYDPATDALAHLEKRAWQGCNSGGASIATNDIDIMRDWLFQNGDVIMTVAAGQWLVREYGSARLCILNDDHSAQKNIKNWEQGFITNYIAHNRPAAHPDLGGIDCCPGSDW
ncbi:uncharacterized protein N0V89_006294 [Didymosphaeria variabile]|uniref:Ecp2 effector protein domain-containing protein n=1 Tax=Didymosphaeria variabile TaxID=1932322 RepID=A0A9W8XQ44_9PLEO|nr:uncharacterized protein N0V89_006294 [Didymosphaeria variabile]KAJ4354557.1 hypothetical protein N0V89_006294 [Didymosphaeria variabile]